MMNRPITVGSHSQERSHTTIVATALGLKDTKSSGNVTRNKNLCSPIIINNATGSNTFGLISLPWSIKLTQLPCSGIRHHNSTTGRYLVVTYLNGVTTTNDVTCALPLFPSRYYWLRCPLTGDMWITRTDNQKRLELEIIPHNMEMISQTQE